MNIQTFSIVTGSEACNAKCPFCIASMTPNFGVQLKEPEVNWRNFEKACILAHQQKVTTVMLTGKGEPTLFPGQINKYLDNLVKYNFPFIEIQTNGLKFLDNPERYDLLLKQWYEKGLTTVAVSIVHYEPKMNRKVYTPDRANYIHLPELINKIHNIGLSVRLSTISLDGFIDGVGKLENLVKFAKENKVEQLTIIPVNKPEDTRDDAVHRWVKEHHLKEEQYREIKNYLETNGTPVMNLAHGATIYDVNNQNVCLSNCLTKNNFLDGIRNLIFFPDGHLRYDWQHGGAILL